MIITITLILSALVAINFMLLYYKLIFFIFLTSIFGVIIFNNLIKKLVLLTVSQSSVILIYLISGYYNFSLSIKDDF